MLKFDFGWGSAPDPVGGAYSAPPDPIAGGEGAPRPSASIFGPSGLRLRRLRRLVVPPSTTIRFPPALRRLEYTLAGGLGGLNPPAIFSTHPTQCQILYWGSVHTAHVRFTSQFRKTLTAEKNSTPQLFFHNSNPGSHTCRSLSLMSVEK